MRTLWRIFQILGFMAYIGLFVWMFWLMSIPTEYVEVQVVVEVPMSPADVQQFLKEQNLYHGKIDSIWGPQTERAWFDWCAIQAINKMPKKKDDTE